MSQRIKPHNGASSNGRTTAKKSTKKTSSVNGPIHGQYTITENGEVGQVNYQVPNTPYWVRGNTKDGYFITMGMRRLTEPDQDVDETMAKIENRDYGLLLNTMVAIAEDVNKVQEQVKQGVTVIEEKKEDDKPATNSEDTRYGDLDPDLYHG